MTAVKHVLFVLESDPAVRDSLKFSLEVEGFEVRVYASSDELLNCNNLETAGCLIVHYHLPGMNGLDVIAKAREKRHSLPALLITGRPNPKVLRRASVAGVAVVKKPIPGTELLDCLRNLLDGPSHGGRGLGTGS